MRSIPKRLALISAILCLALLSAPLHAAPFNVQRGQIALQELGYAPGPADGIYGPATRSAIKRFQRHHGLAVTGRFNQPTVTRLRHLMQRRHMRR
ncbi:peptidoglycan-binding protein [Marichromatium purpuratum 984]|uniref:Peptidoglycan-binding protein n=1 Tax=Marichromatium purpuratum 984 TaxID=765910 RepID=W0E0R4_MARPU|nr:peptidoglycan-binding domain-containing protein [Marichromatium purpuratum]AHF02676.1 peptidoglycan-binding protein [Marichromatium purpuratum 984]